MKLVRIIHVVHLQMQLVCGCTLLQYLSWIWGCITDGPKKYKHVNKTLMATISLSVSLPLSIQYRKICLISPRAIAKRHSLNLFHKTNEIIPQRVEVAKSNACFMHIYVFLALTLWHLSSLLYC